MTGRAYLAWYLAVILCFKCSRGQRYVYLSTIPLQPIPPLAAKLGQDRLWKDLDTDDLGALAGALKILGSAHHVEWLPDSGCAILALGQLPPGAAGLISTAPEPKDQDLHLLGDSNLFVVALDGLRFWMHRCVCPSTKLIPGEVDLGSGDGGCVAVLQVDSYRSSTMQAVSTRTFSVVTCRRARARMGGS